MSNTAFSRPTAVMLLLALGVCFGANHVAARVAFDNGVGITTAVLARSGVTAFVLLGVIVWQRIALPAKGPHWGWVLLSGVLISLQSLALYSAVARIPVALALLVFNTMPVVYALLTWLLGGKRPGRKSLLYMGVILLGLALALDTWARLQGTSLVQPGFAAGVGFALAAALLISCALWITENRLASVPGILRSQWAMTLVFFCMLGVGQLGLLPGGSAWPHNALGWWSLVALVVCYGTAFSLWFIWMPRLDMARNASAMNIEPIAVLVLAWVFLGQTLTTVQLLGAAVVVAAIVQLARIPKT